LINRSLTRSTNAAASRLLTLTALVVVIVGLYVGRQVLIPLALAVVLAFLLTPVVNGLQRCRLGRVPAVLLVLVLGAGLLGSLGWIITGQLMDIVDQFPSYKSNLHDKIQTLRIPNGSRLKNATNTVTELNNELSAASESAAEKKTVPTSSARPIPVRVAQPPSDAGQFLRAMIGPLAGLFEMTALVIVFAVFMLVQREDLRNRVIRLAGQGDLTVVTQALDDGSRRLSRYLLLQFLVNLVYGVIFGYGAYWIGIPHALLWGVLGGLLRFVPYVGTPIATAFPIAMASAVFPGWHQAGIIFGLFVVLELIVGNVIEPWLYGAHTGISSLAILVAAVFWATLWGPVGLILSTPLTVCLILMGRYVPQLSFLEVLLGDEPVLPVEAHFYQRLLALDQEEARDIADSYIKDHSIIDFYDRVLIPALALAEQDRHVNSLEAATASFVNQSARELIEELGERSWGEPVLDKTLRNEMARVVCIPARDEPDELVLLMVGQMLERMGYEVDHEPAAAGDGFSGAEEGDTAQVVFISAFCPFATGKARSLCKSLRRTDPERKIILALWGTASDVAKARDRVAPASADIVVSSLREAESCFAKTDQPGPVVDDTSPQSELAQGITAPDL